MQNIQVAFVDTVFWGPLRHTLDIAHKAYYNLVLFFVSTYVILGHHFWAYNSLLLFCYTNMEI
jgi:hypothetical protein